MFDDSCNVFYGENAQGKTNLLEAIYYLSCGKSTRSHLDKELIHFNCMESQIKGSVYSRDREYEICLDLYQNKRKKISINGIQYKNNSSLTDVFHTVFFSPDDLFLIKAGAGERRKFLNQTLCQLRPKYDEALSEYTKLHDNKMKILKEADDHPDFLEILPDYNARMIVYGSQIIHYRAEYTNRLKEYASTFHRECSGNKETLDVHYKTLKNIENPLLPLTEIQELYRIHMNEHYEAELASKTCLSGPHKDDLELLINGEIARQFGSQGQARTAALSLKLADREIHKNVFGQYPIMLLDDVLSELDSKRQEFVLNKIRGGQIFITCCENDRLGELLGGKVFNIRQGKVIV